MLERSQRRLLRRDGTEVALSPKLFDALLLFTERAGDLLDKDELMRTLWAGLVVEENNLNQVVFGLRRALGDDAHGSRFIQTVPRRGFRFIADVKTLSAPPAAESAGPSAGAVPLSADPPRPRRQLGWAATLAGAGSVAGATWWHRTLVGVAALVCAIGGLSLWFFSQSRPPYTIDEELASRFSMFVAPFVEDDGDGKPSQFGRTISGDISTLLLKWNTRLITPEQGAKYVLGGRILRRHGGGIAIDTQMRNLATGETYALIQPSFASEEEAVQSDLAVRVMRAMWNQRDEIILAQARRPGHEPDPLELLYLGRNELDRSRSEADIRHAEERFEGALRKDPTSFWALLGLTSTCIDHLTRLYSAEPRKDFALCERRIARLYASAPEKADAMNARAFVLQVQGRFEEAVVLLRKSLKLQTKNRVGHFNMARALTRLGRFDEAAPHLDFLHSWAERAGEHGPFDHRLQGAYYVLFADVAFLQDDEDKAYEWLRRGLAEMPNNGSVLLRLAALDALNGRDEQAKAHMKRHLELSPRSNVGYIGMFLGASNPAIAQRYARLLDGIRKAGLPEGPTTSPVTVVQTVADVAPGRQSPR